MKEQIKCTETLFMVFGKVNLFSGLEIEDSILPNSINTSTFFVIEEKSDDSDLYSYETLNSMYKDGDLIKVSRYIKDGVFHKEVSPVNDLDLYLKVKEMWYSKYRKEFAYPKNVDKRLSENIERLKNKESEMPVVEFDFRIISLTDKTTNEFMFFDKNIIKHSGGGVTGVRNLLDLLRCCDIHTVEFSNLEHYSIGQTIGLEGKYHEIKNFFFIDDNTDELFIEIKNLARKKSKIYSDKKFVDMMSSRMELAGGEVYDSES